MSAFTNTNKFHTLSLGISLHSAIEGVADWRSRELRTAIAIVFVEDRECDRAADERQSPFLKSATNA